MSTVDTPFKDHSDCSHANSIHHTGNDDVDACNVAPAYASNAITVGAFDPDRKKAWYSNWGSCVDIWAPGSDIYSSIADTSGDQYGYLSGTSMASPMIAGVVANILMVQPTLSFSGVIDALLNSSVNVTSDQCDTYECRAPIYSCGIKRFGEKISWNRNSGLSEIVLVIIIIGCTLGIIFMIGSFGVYFYRKRQQVSHQKISSEDDDFEVDTDLNVNQYRESQAIVDATDARDFGSTIEPVVEGRLSVR